jgi:hypothetical protein
MAHEDNKKNLVENLTKKAAVLKLQELKLQENFTHTCLTF